MATPEVLYELLGDGIAKVTLNRPDKRNALSPSLAGALCGALEVAQADAAARVVVVAAAGKVFCAGGDLRQLAEGGGVGGDGAAGASAGRTATLVELLLAMDRLEKPTVAMVHGHALAGGLGVVLACDLVVAAEEAQLGLPEIGVGLWPMMVMAQLFRNVPRKKGLELILAGESIPAREGERIGIVNRVVPAARLEAETLALARALARKSPSVMALGLRALREMQEMPLGEALPYLERQLRTVLATEDAREGLAAFLEKREPHFSGR